MPLLLHGSVSKMVIFLLESHDDIDGFDKSYPNTPPPPVVGSPWTAHHSPIHPRTRLESHLPCLDQISPLQQNSSAFFLHRPVTMAPLWWRGLVVPDLGFLLHKLSGKKQASGTSLHDPLWIVIVSNHFLHDLSYSHPFDVQTKRLRIV